MSSPSHPPGPPVAAAAQRDDIAIVGLACRFPGAADAHEYWSAMDRGAFCVTEIPADRWSIEAHYSPDREAENKTVSKWGGFMADIDKFDAPLFHVSPREAELMDPQQRIMLELAWACIEDAGYAPSQLRGSETGVYLGVCNFDYKVMVERSLSTLEAHVSTGVHTTLIPNRISFEFDLKGPSVPVDTACSSSLVALEEAVHALRRGDCTAALVGGVSVLLSPTHFISFSKAGMLSPRGVCRSFDEGADGYVRGEGAALMLLKPLQAALRDGDRIHGLIKGVAVNHGGKVATVTSPNPFAQSQVIVKAFRDAGISPASVNYIEAHGTGTPKGDPIEINALVRAFGSLAKAHGGPLPERSCAIGSVKTGIGHLEAAAGVAGIVKVLLAMQHRRLPALQHFHKLNPRVKVDGSPFHFVTEPMAWEPGADGVRRAGVSSFGFGGVNAHVLLEEAPPFDEPAAAPGTAQPLLFVLSAKTADSLLGYAARLARWLEAAAPPPAPESLAYSLQRREAMEERVAFEARDAGQLLARLNDFIAGKPPAEGTWRSNLRDGHEWAELVGNDREMAGVLQGWMTARQNARLAKAWVRGVPLPAWEHYYAGGCVPPRLRLPTYAFARRRYWFDDGRELRHEPLRSAAPVTSAVPVQAAVLHPLLHRNTSTLAVQRFSTRWTGDEFFLADHRVRGERVLPGVAYLEMARAGLQHAAEPSVGTALEFRQVVWARPLVVREAAVEAHLGLYPLDGDNAGFVAYEVTAGAGDAAQVHAQGRMRLQTAQPAATVDLDALRRRLAGGERSVDAAYAGFAAAGIDYGPAHRAMCQVWSADDAAGRFDVLARLALPPSVAADANAFGLHPSLMDAALQAALSCGPRSAGASPAATFVPFSVERIEVADAQQPLPPELWAWLRPVATAGGAATLEARLALPFDIDLIDAQGRVHVALRGFSFRALGGTPALMLLRPAWKAADDEPAPTGPAPGRVLFAGFDGERSARRTAWMDGLRAAGLAGVEELDSTGATFEARALALLEQVQSWMRAGGADPLQLVVPAEGPQAVHQALAALLKTARVEHPHGVAQMLAVHDGVTADALLRHLRAAAARPAVATWRCETGRRWAGVLEELPPGPAAAPGPWKEGGVYLITGGAGGLGRVFAREIAHRLRRATVVLAGRSGQAGAVFEDLRAAVGPDIRLEYRPLDVTSREAVAALVHDTVERHGGLNGIIHAAGLLRDQYLLRKPAAEFAQVMAPKASGVRHLADAAADVPLDFFAMFASIAGALGNAGQADYATANAYLDAFARHCAPARWGRTVAIDWPLWAEGGMAIDDATAHALHERWGMVPLATASGLAAFQQALASREPQVVVIEGTRARMRRALLAPAPEHAPAAAAAPRGEAETQDKVQAALLDIAARLLKLSPDELDTRTELSEYGFDSIAYTALANRIGERYGIEVSPTVFFDFPTLAGITGHLWEHHRDRLAAPEGAGTSAAAPAAAPAAEREAADAADRADTLPALAPLGHGFRLAPPPATPTAAPLPAATAATHRRPEPIAVVGMSGSFPKARDLAAFWRNLEQGADCISEVPALRWDWQAIWGDPTQDGDRSDVKWGGFMDGVDEFDPLFFGISPREAQLMDPQQRLLMMHVWQALEDAGYAASRLAGSSTGVFIGTASLGYAMQVARAGLPVEGYSATGSVPSVGPNRISYLLNLHGPSEPVETACSSSLVAIHRAIQSIEAGECDQALVGGVNTLVAPDLHISFNKAGMLAHDGRCKTFSKAANGYVRGEGVGVLFLKRLSAAEADGDHIYGLVLGSAENHGGRANSLTSPNSKAQAEVLVKAYRKAGIDARTVGYLEAHGTGTPLGDPVEVNGIKAAFRTLYDEASGPGPGAPHCALGSVKTNIGHLELAAGVAGVIKVLLQFQHRRIAASLHCEEINPHIELEGTPFHVARQTRDWQPLQDTEGRELPLRAGVSSFGFGGVNAHVVLESYGGRPQGGGDSPGGLPQIVPVSARNAAALRRYVQSLVEFIDARPEVALQDLAYTLQVGRDALDERLAVVAHSAAELRSRLQAFLDGQEGVEDLYHGQAQRHREVLASLAHDEDLQVMMTAWVRKGRYGRCLGLWVKGAGFDWSVLHAGGPRPRRISAPTYPFARDSYWVRPGATAASPAVTPPADDAVLRTLAALERGAVSLEQALSAVADLPSKA